MNRLVPSKIADKIFYYLLSFFVFIISTFFVIFPSLMIQTAKDTILLFCNIILPSLLPFLILAELIEITEISKIFGKILSPIMRYIFRLPGISALAVFLGMIGGYPLGAKVTADLRQSNFLTQNEANHLIAFSNNTGPLFISGAVAIGLYGSSKIGLLLMISHYISALIIGLLFSFKKNIKPSVRAENFTYVQTIRINKIGQILTEIILKSLKTIAIVGGFILFFAIVTTALKELKVIEYLANVFFPFVPTEAGSSIIIGLLEVTNGISNIAMLTDINLNLKLILTSFLISFGGFSIHMQTLSVIAKTDINKWNYFLGKTLQGFLSGVITLLLLRYTAFSNVVAIPTLATYNFNSPGFINLISVITLLFVLSVIYKIVETIMDR